MASVSSATTDPTSGNNSAAQNTTVQPSADLSITKSDSSDPAPSGSTLTYTIVVTNNSIDAAQTVTVTDNLPSDVTFVSCASTGVGSCGGSGNNRTITFTSIAASSSETVTLIARINHSAAGTTISNTASVASTGTFDPVSGNNSAIQMTTVVAPSLAVSQLYTAGGASSAAYNRDYIEIFNRGTVAINLSGLSVQYAPTGTGTFTVISSLPGFSLQPRQYFLISAGTTNALVGAALPTVDAIGSGTNMTGSVGKVAIVLGTTALTSSNVSNPPLTVGNASPGCPTSASLVIDFIGYGTTAACYEGTARAPDPTQTNNQQAGFRANGGCTDTNHNGADFSVASASPRNSSTIKPSCP